MDREFILSEIRRAARVVGGGPLGRATFEQLTGISEGVWRGKYWLNWSDAVAAAGVQAGRLNAAFTEEFLLSRLAELTSHLGRFPTQAEKRMRRNTDASFPNDKVFDRFGNRAAQMESLRRFALGREAFRHILALLPAPVGQELPEPDRPAEPGEVIEGFVYMLKLGNAFKIGRTSAVPRRHREIALELPEKPAVVHTIRTDDPEGIESYWHRRFAAKRTNGEWFALAPADVKAFKRRKFM